MRRCWMGLILKTEPAAGKQTALRRQSSRALFRIFSYERFIFRGRLCAIFAAALVCCSTQQYSLVKHCKALPAESSAQKEAPAFLAHNLCRWSCAFPVKQPTDSVSGRGLLASLASVDNSARGYPLSNCIYYALIQQMMLTKNIECCIIFPHNTSNVVFTCCREVSGGGTGVHLRWAVSAAGCSWSRLTAAAQSEKPFWTGYGSVEANCRICSAGLRLCTGTSETYAGVSDFD